MSNWIVVGTAIGYLISLFGLAYWVEKRKEPSRSLVGRPIVYSLSLAVYCTAWTYFGSVGRAAEAGIAFLPIYLGPTLIAPVWVILLKKIIRISKAQRLTSIADFISARYGKSTTLGILATLVAVAGVVPYISIQVKAITDTYYLLVPIAESKDEAFAPDASIYITLALAAFSIFLGTRRLDPNERHEGLVFAVAIESVLKLLGFLAIGIFVTFFLFDGVGDLFSRIAARPELERLYVWPQTGTQALDWLFLLLISMSAVLLLPRQFHVAVVENVDTRQVNQASWLFPLYLLLINLFVLPIAAAGLLRASDLPADNYVIGLPTQEGMHGLALFAALGGFSAATAMVLVSVIALSIMVSNNLVLPFLVRSRVMQEEPYASLSRRLLGIRRVSILAVMLLALGYYKWVGFSYTLVSIGLISFVAVAQFLPAVMGGLYWKRGTKRGALLGLSTGFLIWAYTLALPTLSEAIPEIGTWMERPRLADWGLHPHQFLGLEGLSPITQSTFWSLFFNSLLYVLGSLFTKPDGLELTQADLFVHFHKYDQAGSETDVMRRRALTRDLLALMERFLGKERSDFLLNEYEKKRNLSIRKSRMAGEDLIHFVEVQLSGSLGAASAKVLIRSIAREDPIGMEEMLKVLDQTQEAVQYSKALEEKSRQLEKTTDELRKANEKLLELDRLKAGFISTVTHELRTPITAIRGMAGILRDFQDLETEKREAFLEIVYKESERLSRLVNQVLDVEKIPRESADSFHPLDLSKLVAEAEHSLDALIREKGIECTLALDPNASTLGNGDRLTQVVVNLLSNAIKFCPDDKGKIDIRLSLQAQNLVLSIRDNGIGIPEDQQDRIFEQFTQLDSPTRGKPGGSGLGLYISRQIIENHGGSIHVKSRAGEGACFVVNLPSYQTEPKPDPQKGSGQE